MKFPSKLARHSSHGSLATSGSTSRRAWSTAVGLSFIASLAGCGAAVEGEESRASLERAEDDPLSARQQRITGSGRTTDSNTNPSWPEVVSVTTSEGMCSGTLISPVHVLTAGHCGTGSRVRLDSPAFGDAAARTYNVIRTWQLDWRANSGSDLAVLLLDLGVSTSGTPGAPQYAVTPALISPGLTDTTTSVGYGKDCTSNASGVRRAISYGPGLRTYAAYPGVLTRLNLGCGNTGYRGPNPGDSGGPLFNSRRQVIGVFSGYSCRISQGAIGQSGCAGTLEWTHLNITNWGWVNTQMRRDTDSDGVADFEDKLPGVNCQSNASNPLCVQWRPDFEVVDVANGGCDEFLTTRRARVQVRNRGTAAGRARLDVFVGLWTAPTIGRLSSTYNFTSVLAPGASQVVHLDVAPPANPSWVDALVDTTRAVNELDETNNHGDAYVTFDDCR